MSETSASSAPNASLQKKSAARMAAVQSLYTLSFHDTRPSIAKQIASLKERLHNNQGEQKLLVGKAVEPNYKLVETLLTGIEDNADEINHRIDGVFSGDWTRDRTSPILIAILQCSVYELFFSKEINPKIILDEYSRLTRHFFGDAEVDFVYGALASLVQQYG